jgi:virginiamycin B lyase
MKIARSSVQNALAPGLIPVLLLVLVTASQAIAQKAAAVVNGNGTDVATVGTVQQVTLSGSDKEVAATTTSGSLTVVSGTFTEFSMPKGTVPQLLASASDGTIYQALGGANKIAQVNAASATNSVGVKMFAIPTANSFPVGIVVAADGSVWFAEQNAHQIGHLDPKSGKITEYKTPTPNSGPVGITVGPDNAIWFTEAFASKIGRLDPEKPEAMEEFTIPTPVSAPLYITTGPDGGLWYVGVRSHKLGRIDPETKAFAEYPTPTEKAGPTSVLTGPDGALWVSQLNADKIARFDVSARKFTDDIPLTSRKNGPRAGPGILVNGPDGNIWFTQMLGNQIARLNPTTREIFEFSVPTALVARSVGVADTAAQAMAEAQTALGAEQTLGPTAGPGGIVFSSDGNIWYSAIFADLVSRLRVK